MNLTDFINTFEEKQPLHIYLDFQCCMVCFLFSALTGCLLGTALYMQTLKQYCLNQLLVIKLVSIISNCQVVTWWGGGYPEVVFCSAAGEVSVTFKDRLLYQTPSSHKSVNAFSYTCNFIFSYAHTKHILKIYNVNFDKFS